MEPAFLLPEVILYTGKQRERKRVNFKITHTDLKNNAHLLLRADKSMSLGPTTKPLGTKCLWRLGESWGISQTLPFLPIELN